MAIEDKDIEENHHIAAVSYIWVLSLVVLFAQRRSSFSTYHARQGLVLFVLSTLGIFIPIPAGRIIFEILCFAGIIAGFIHASLGQYHPLPLIYDISIGNFKPKDIAKDVVRIVRAPLAVAKLLAKKPAAAKAKSGQAEKQHEKSQPEQDVKSS